MSTQEVSISSHDAASAQGTQQNTGQTAQHATSETYQAPYYHYDPGSIPGSYIVMFKQGHTIAKHFASIGREFDVTTLDGGYFVEDFDDDELFEAIRHDPGVKFIEDDVSGDRDG